MTVLSVMQDVPTAFWNGGFAKSPAKLVNYVFMWRNRIALLAFSNSGEPQRCEMLSMASCKHVR